MYRFCNAIASAGAAPPQPADDGCCHGPAVLLLDRQRRIVSLSPAVRVLLTGGDMPVEISVGTLAARDGSSAWQLAAAFRALTNGEPSRTLRLGKKAAQIELALTALHGDGLFIAVILRRLGQSTSLQAATLARRFGLTPAESRLLEMLCGGASIGQASAGLGVARTTVRTHLQRIFDKAGVHRQAELVHLALAH